MERADRVPSRGGRVLASVPALVLIPCVLVAAVTGSSYARTLTIQLAILVTCAVAWHLASGISGTFSYGHAAFVGGGAYAAALLGSISGWSAGPMVLGATAAGAALGAAVGALAWRARGAYFAMLTMAIQLMLHRTAFIAGEPLGGGQGISSLPRLSRASALAMPVGLALATLWVVARLERGRFGRRLRAIGSDEVLAQATGIATNRAQWFVLTLSGALSGMAGGVHAVSFGQVSPELLGGLLSANLVLLGVLGGASGAPGVALAALVFGVLRHLLLPLRGFDALALALLLLAWLAWKAPRSMEARVP